MHQELQEAKVQFRYSRSCPTCEQEFDSDSAHHFCPNDSSLLCVIEDIDVGTTIGSYEIIAKVGEGASSQVYRAKHKTDENVVAIKLLKLNLVSDPVAVRRFEQEARAITTLSHPNIAEIKEFGILSNGRPFIVMDLVGSETLADVLKRQQKIEPHIACLLFLQITEALAAANRRGILHRDIKPSNVGIDQNGQARVLDFGIAKVTRIDTTSTLTRTGAAVGTPAYMSPEQCLGLELDQRSDIYSLGCLMYECLTGKKPFESDNSFLCMQQHCDTPPSSSALKALMIPPLLVHAIMLCLQKSPGRRFRSLSELHAVLLGAASRNWGYKVRAALVIAAKVCLNRLHATTSSALSQDSTAQPYKPEQAKGSLALVASMLVVGSLVAFCKFHSVEPSVQPVERVLIEGQSNSVQTEKPKGVVYLEKQFADIESEIAALKRQHNDKDAEEMKAELQKYKNRFRDRTPLSDNGETRIHAISVSKGLGGLNETLRGLSIPGEVVVAVTDTHNPAILILTSNAPANWTVTTRDGVTLKEIVVNGPAPQTINDQPSNVPVSFMNNDAFNLTSNIELGSSSYKRDMLSAKVRLNADIVTFQTAKIPHREFVVGRESTDWTAQNVAFSMQDFYSRCMRRKANELLANLKSLRFDALWLSGHIFDVRGSIGQFNGLGPVQTARINVDAPILGAASVTKPDSKKIWYLLSDGRDDGSSIVDEYDPTSKRLTHLLTTNSKASSVWWGYRAITYDTKRNEIVIFNDGDAQPLTIYNVAKKTWIKTGKRDFMNVVHSICYRPEDDSIWAIGTALPEQHQRRLFQLRNHELVRSIPISGECYTDVVEPSKNLQLHSVGPYLIAILTDTESVAGGDSSDRYSIASPRVMVIERLTGKLVYSGVMFKQADR